MASTRKASFYLSLLPGILIAAASFYGFHLLRGRPGLPDGTMAVIANALRRADIVRIGDLQILRPSELELALAGRSIGESVTLEVRPREGRETVQTLIIPYYSRAPFPTIYLVIGLLSFLVGFLALAFRWEDRKARILFWLAIVFALCVMVGGGTYCLRTRWTTYVPMILFYVLYPLAPALLVHFASAFLQGKRTAALIVTYGISLLFGAALTTLVLLSLRRLSTHLFRSYAALFTLFRGYQVVLLLLAVLTLLWAYRSARLQENRAQIKWIFLGMVFSLGPYVSLYQFPRALGLTPPLSEDAAAVFFIFAPLGLALAISRFRFLDVEIVINRSLVYSLLTVLTAVIYLFSVGIFRDLPFKLFAATGTTASLGSALLAAVVFQPARRRIQALVDKSFFRRTYDYKQAILRFNDSARTMSDQAGLVEFLKAHIRTVLPTQRLEVAIGEERPDG